MNFELPLNKSTSIIKVLGVGGGGSNAVNHMFRQGIKGVDFIVCNTDSQALHNSPVPDKIQLGASLTEGRGAGNRPEIGEQAAIENIEDGATVNDFLAWFPGVSREQVEAVLEHAERSLALACDIVSIGSG